MSSTLLQDDIDSMLSSVFDETDDPIYVVNPSQETISSLMTTLERHDGDLEVRVLGDERTLKDVMDDFLVASTAADLVEAGTLSMRVLETVPNHSVAVTSEGVYALVTIGDVVGGLGTDDDVFVDDAADYYEETWENAEEYSLRTPAITKVQSTL